MASGGNGRHIARRERGVVTVVGVLGRRLIAALRLVTASLTLGPEGNYDTICESGSFRDEAGLRFIAAADRAEPLATLPCGF